VRHLTTTPHSNPPAADQGAQQAGWIGVTSLHFSVPGWMSLWFSIFPNLQTVVAQLLAAAFVIGSYLLAEYLRVQRARRRAGRTVPHRPPKLPSAQPSVLSAQGRSSRPA
jgi:high-affinity iron transporter